MTVEIKNKNTGMVQTEAHVMAITENDGNIEITYDDIYDIIKGVKYPLYMYEVAEIKADPKGWVDTKDCLPLLDGVYLVQTVYGEVTAMNYTFDGGWNTHRDMDGNLSDESAMPDTYVARWHQCDTPKAVPKEWKEAHVEEYRKGVNK